ncbi:CAAX prenyl protease 1 [Babesia duncani]|uniref:CAAX prenyl protease 1 n=1 Tax=Babesia duncani TaxID=323732 RepID=A0AAD9UQH0_9APIC|nr:CAAX prenyl protease 1 [Babesia duncani]
MSLGRRVEFCRILLPCSPLAPSRLMSNCSRMSNGRGTREIGQRVARVRIVALWVGTGARWALDKMTIENLLSGPLHFEFYICALVLNEAFEHFLNFRQLRVINRQMQKKVTAQENDSEATKKAKQAVNVYLERPEYAQTVQYARDKLVFGIWSSIIQFVISLVLLFNLFGPKLWNYARNQLGYESEYKQVCYYECFACMQSIIFCGVKMLIDTVLEIPFGLYSDFVIEQRHGFNNKTLGLFFKDLLISLILQALIGTPILCGLIFLVRWGGESFYLYTFAFVALVLFVMHAVYPDLIAPLFNKYEPLKEGELKSAIEQLVRTPQKM